jgi:uncharacterized small protein (DUF1192 family)
VSHYIASNYPNDIDWYVVRNNELHARIAALEAENARLQALYDKNMDVMIKLEAEIGPLRTMFEAAKDFVVVWHLWQEGKL